MSFTFMHIADIHLSRQFSDLSVYSLDSESINKYKSAVEEVFNNCINLAINKNVDFVLIAGDTFDSEEHDFSSKLILKTGLKKLDSMGIKVFLIAGNHDPISSYNKNTFNFDENSNIKIIGLNTPISGSFEFIDKKSEKQAIIHALSFKDKTFSQNPIEYFDHVTEVDKQYFHIGLMHCDLDGAKDSPYAPVSKQQLIDLNYNYWALGHIHIPCNVENICYSGTIQGRNTKETGAHGVNIITVENNKIVNNEFYPTDVIRYYDLDIDITNAIDDTNAFEIISDSIKTLNIDCELALIRINLIGNVCFYDCIDENFYNELSQQISSEYNSKILISQINNNTIASIEKELLLEDEGISGELYKTIQNEETVNKIFDEINTQLKKVINDCMFTAKEAESFKNSVISKAKEDCINLCSYVYNSESKED